MANAIDQLTDRVLVLGRLTIVRLSPCGLRVTAALPMYSPALTQQDEQS